MMQSTAEDLLGWLEAVIVLLSHLAEAEQLESSELLREQLRTAGTELAQAVQLTDGQTIESIDWSRFLVLMTAWEQAHFPVVSMLRKRCTTIDASAARLQRVLAERASTNG